MKIVLCRTGGIIPLQKRAETTVALPESDEKELLHCLQNESVGNTQLRDNSEYRVIINEKSFSVNWKRIPDKFKPIFERLKDNLQVVKPR